MPSGVYKRTKPNHWLGRKHTPETIEKIRQDNLKNPRRYWLGKKRPSASESTKEKMRANAGRPWLGKNLSQEHKKKLSAYNKGKVMSKEVRQKISEALKGEKSYLWKGGISSFKEEIKGMMEYREWQRSVLLRDGFCCKKCGTKNSGKMETHHLTSFSHLVQRNDIANLDEARECEELWDIENGVTLCEKCHRETPNYSYRASSNPIDETDYSLDNPLQ